jgi:Tol biopolymer transport system component
MLAVVLVLSSNKTLAQAIGLFDAGTDVGAVRHAGTSVYNNETQQYSLSGSGKNIWGTADEFHYLWKRMKGNFILHARGRFTGKGADPHRKWGWMIRSSLDTGAAMASVQVHGDGLAAFQYRARPGGTVEEKRSVVEAPDVIQLERREGRYIMSVARFGEPFTTQEIDSIPLNDDVYVGLFVCAHNEKAVEQATFSNVRIVVPAGKEFVQYRQYLGSHMELITVATGDREIIYSEPVSLQAPNWTVDGRALLYNSNGLIYRLDLNKKKPEVVNTGFVKHNNNDHVISFDGKMLGLSSSSGDPKLGSLVYTVPVKGGTPKQITPLGPSYLHGWSPDGKHLVYVGQRNNEFDIYKIPATGGPEVRLTNTTGLDDGPEYSPDGKYIYFNSVRSGTMQLWRMQPDGSAPEQLTNDAYNNWFPHISPDGKWIVFLSFMQDVKPDDHPFYKHVYLRLMPAGGGKPQVLAYVYGGQGTINTPSWSPDSKRLAFVSNTDFQKKP